MGEKTLPCPYCGKSFADENGRWMHAKQKHPRKPLKALKTAAQFAADERARQKDPRHDEPSMAELMIDAQLRRAMGEPVEDWIADMLP